MRLRGDRTRALVRRLHLWLGLSLGLLLVLLGLTGSVLVFYPEIDALLHPEIRAEARVPADWDRALDTVRRAYPDKNGPWRFEVTDAHGAIPARYYDPPERASRAFAPMMVWLSPDGEQVLRRDYWGEYAMTFIYDLHYRLLLGKAGALVLGYAGLALLVLLVSGLWAWWPRGQWSKALRFKRGSDPIRQYRDWHKLAGLWTLPLLMMLTLTGVMLELPQESDAVLGATLGRLDALPAPPRNMRPQGAHIPVSRAIAIGQQTLPKARLAWIETPGANGGFFRLRMGQPGDPSHRFPHSFVWIDPSSGAVAATFDSGTSGTSTTINNWVHPLHDGSAAGLPGRILICLIGLIPTLLLATGYARWRLRRQHRLAKA